MSFRFACGAMAGARLCMSNNAAERELRRPQAGHQNGEELRQDERR